MKKIFLLSFLFSIFLQAQYQPLINTDNVLNYQYRTSLMCEEVTPQQFEVDLFYSFGGQVSFNGMTYTELYRTFNFDSLDKFLELKQCSDNYELNQMGLNEGNYNSDMLIGYLREDNDEQKVYFLSLNEEESLLYDFALSVGEVVLGFSLNEINASEYFNVENTERLKYSYEGDPVNSAWFYFYEGIGSSADFILRAKTCNNTADGECFRLKGLSQDNGDSFFDVDNEPITLKVDEVLKALEIMVYPNPIQDYIRLKTSTEVKTIQLYDMVGNLVLSLNNVDENDINVRFLKSGTYILKIVMTNGQAVTKTVVKK